MPRFLILLFLLLFHVSIYAQTATQIAATKCHAFRTVVGRNYLISVVPESNADAVLGIGFAPRLPMAVINSQGGGMGEVYKTEAASNELQVCVYLNQKDAKHAFVVIDQDHGFPFFMWSADSTVALETDERGYIGSYKFHWKKEDEVASKANSVPRSTQFIAPDSGISYTFNVTPGTALDFLLVPETNHLDLAVHADIGNGYEVVDYNRSASDISETNGGQVEWFQTYPAQSEMTIVVANKSSFGGRFKIAARGLVNTKELIPPKSWRYLDAPALKQFIDASRVSFPFISETQAVTFEFTPSRLIGEYLFAAYALEPGLEFALIVRTDPNKPPLFVQAGGESTRSAPFYWNVVAGQVSLPGNSGSSSEKLSGYPSPGKIQISIVSYGGNGRVGLHYKDAETLANLDPPPHKNLKREEIVSLFSAAYEPFVLIQSNFRLYRFAAVDGESYNVKVIPDDYFDPVIMDPSGRTIENPASLELIDENGRGYPEYLEVTARGELLEFAVAGTRYVHGRVNAENKRLGGTGYFRYEVTDREGKRPEFLEAVEVSLPNEFVSNEIKVLYQPWDPFPALGSSKSSEYPPFQVIYDKRILEALGKP